MSFIAYTYCDRVILWAHRYVTSSQYVEARDQELYLPMLFLTALATCTALAIASPLAELHPQKVRLCRTLFKIISHFLRARYSLKLAGVLLARFVCTGRGIYYD